MQHGCQPVCGHTCALQPVPSAAAARQNTIHIVVLLLSPCCAISPHTRGQAGVRCCRERACRCDGCIPDTLPPFPPPAMPSAPLGAQQLRPGSWFQVGWFPACSLLLQCTLHTSLVRRGSGKGGACFTCMCRACGRCWTEHVAVHTHVCVERHM